MTDNISRRARLFLSRMRDALPAIVLYIIQIALVYAVFGLDYIMVAACSTGVFQTRSARINTPADCVAISGGFFLMCVLAFAATRSTLLGVALNLTVPFLLVVSMSSQFAPKSHFGFAMTYFFLQLIPVSAEKFLVQLAAAALCAVTMSAALLLRSRIARAGADSQLSSSLMRLSEILAQLACDPNSNIGAMHQELYESAQRFHRMGHSRAVFLYAEDRQRQTFHLFALLFQRAAYLLTDSSADTRAMPEFPDAMRALSHLTLRLRSADSIDDLALLRLDVQSLLDNCSLPNSRLRIFYRSYLHMLLLFCREPSVDKKRVSRRRSLRELLLGVLRRCRPERYEFRFALRLAIVMTVSCTISYLWDFEHTYWFPLHAFLLTQPSYEESAHRMVTRPIGTALGCILIHLMSPWMPGLPQIFAFSIVMIVLMYSSAPGSWPQSMYATGFALALASMAIDETEAIQLRLFYLGMAVALVLVVNAFVLPNRRDRQFRYNMHELFRLQSVYWGVIRRSLHEPVDPALFSELLSEFHMVYHEAWLYTSDMDDGDSSRTMLLRLWRMFSELEQTECLIQMNAIPPESRGELEHLAESLEKLIYPPRGSLEGLDAEAFGHTDLNYVLTHYLKNAKELMGAARVPERI